jgi:hypothetical protein
MHNDICTYSIGMTSDFKSLIQQMKKIRPKVLSTWQGDKEIGHPIPFFDMMIDPWI